MMQMFVNTSSCRTLMVDMGPREAAEAVRQSRGGSRE